MRYMLWLLICFSGPHAFGQTNGPPTTGPVISAADRARLEWELAELAGLLETNKRNLTACDVRLAELQLVIDFATPLPNQTPAPGSAEVIRRALAEMNEVNRIKANLLAEQAWLIFEYNGIWDQLHGGE